MKIKVKDYDFFLDEEIIREYTLLGFIWDKITTLWYRYIYWPYKNYLSHPIYRIKNFLPYLKFFWNDNIIYDNGGIYGLLEIKLTTLRDVLNSDKVGWPHVGDERRVKEINVCLELIRRLKKDEYSRLWFNKTEERYGKDKRERRKLEKGYVSYVTTNPCERRDKAMKRAFMRARYQRNYDRGFLFKLMARKSESWWR